METDFLNETNARSVYCMNEYSIRCEIPDSSAKQNEQQPTHINTHTPWFCWRVQQQISILSFVYPNQCTHCFRADIKYCHTKYNVYVKQEN